MSLAPLPSSDLVPDPSPLDFQFFSVQDRVRSAEFTLSSIREHIRSLFDEHCAIVEASELSGYDLLFAGWPIGRCEIDELYSFWRSTQMLGPHSPLLSPQIPTLISHIQEVHGVVIRLSSVLSVADLS
jgi:hypothetical protein